MRRGKPSMPTLSIQERRTQVYEMRRAGNAWDDIASITGLREATCKAYLKAAVAVDGRPELLDHMNGNAVEVANPELAAEVMAAGMEPFEGDRFKAVREACKAAGMHPKLVAGLVKRMESRYAPVMEEGRRMTVDDMGKQIESKIRLVLAYIDELNISQASAKDLAYLFGILVDRYQLLSNRPTQIVDTTTRQHLTELVPAVMEEARRRGISLVDVPMVERVDGPL